MLQNRQVPNDLLSVMQRVVPVFGVFKSGIVRDFLVVNLSLSLIIMDYELPTLRIVVLVW